MIEIPAPKGSTRAFVRGGRAFVTGDCPRERPWAQAVYWMAREVAPEQPWQGPVDVQIEFVLPRPGRLGRRRTGVPHDHRPDVDKLIRSVLDAITGVFFLDDGQVSSVSARKRYADAGEPAGACLTVAMVEAA